MMLIVAAVLLAAAFATPMLKLLSTFDAGEGLIEGDPVAEISAYDPESKRLFVTNSNNLSLDIFDLADVENPLLIKQIPLPGRPGWCGWRF